MENTKPARSANGGSDNVLELGEALGIILALGPAAVPPAYPGETVWDAVEHLQRIVNEILVAHLNGGDQKVKAAFRALRISVEAVIEAAGQQVQPASGNGKAEEDAVAKDRQDDSSSAVTAKPAVAEAPGHEADDGISGPREWGASAGPAEDQREQQSAGRDLSPEECVNTALRDLWERLAADRETAAFAADYRLEEDSGTDTADLARQRWERLHLMCLRVRSASAEQWRQEAYRQISAVLLKNGHEPGEIHPTEGGPVDSQPEIPSLTEIDYAGTAPLTADGGLPEQLATSAERLDERWMPLARYAAVAYWLDEHDPQLYGGLAGLHTAVRGLTPPGTRSESYRSELIDRVDDLSIEHSDDRTELSRAVSVDEAIRGLVPIPFPARGSWWDAFNTGLTELVTKHLPSHAFVPMTRAPFTSVATQVEKESPQLSSELVHKYHLSPGVVWVLRLGYPENIVSAQSKARVVYVRSG
jgi:hypothetical protein